jgi:2-dehydro-3-deoxy-D-pentonate aldolase
MNRWWEGGPLTCNRLNQEPTSRLADMSMFRGIIPPLVTPLRGPNDLDEDAFCRLIDHVIAGGVHGIFILGTTGEGPSLSHPLQHHTISVATRHAGGRVPVLVGITHPSYFESTSLAYHAANCGASGVVLSAPYYFPAGQDELLDYLSHIVPDLPLPVMLYNMPSMTKLVFEPETIQEALSWPNCVGLKDSSGDINYFRKVAQVVRQRDDFSLLIGPEHLLLESIAMGGHGGVHGGANVCPRLFVSLYEAALAGDATQSLQEQVLKLGRMYAIGSNPASSVVKAIKCALMILGICDDQMAQPFKAFTANERAQVERIIGAIIPRTETC